MRVTLARAAGGRMPHPLPRLACGLALIALCACVSGPGAQERVTIDRSAKPTLAEAPFGDLIEQFVKAPGTLYVRRPRPDLGAYHALRYERPAIFYDASVTPPLVPDHSLLLRALQGALRDNLSAAIPLPETRASGAGVLLVSAEVTDLEFDRARASNSRVASIIQPGRSALFVLQLSDAASGTPLVRVASKRQMPGGIYTGPWSPDIDRAIQLFRGFAKDARESLSHVVRPPAPPE
jgi:hypothetical protein